MIKKILPAIVVLMMVAFASQAQKRQAYNAEKHSYKVHQHVMVTMKDGSEVEAIIHGHISKNKYFVRQFHNKKQGPVKGKYIRAMTEGEIETFKSKAKK